MRWSSFITALVAGHAVLVSAMTLSITGTQSPGQVLNLAWDGISPWSLKILKADNAQSPFSVYKTFDAITVTNAIWNVDALPGAFVEFDIQDSTGSSASQIIEILNPDGTLVGDASASSSSIASVSSVSTESILSTQSLASLTSTSTSDTPTTTSTSTSTSTTPEIVATSDSTSSTLPDVTSSDSSASASASSSPSTSGTSKKGSQVAGAVIGILFGLILIGAALFYCYKRQKRKNMYVGPEYAAYPYTRDGGEMGEANHRRQLSRGHSPGARDTVDWTPDEPHFTPTRGQQNDFFSLPTSNSNALDIQLTPKTLPQLPEPSRSTVFESERTQRTDNIPVYLPTSARLPEPQPTDVEMGTNTSPFADKFSVQGRYEPDYTYSAPQSALGPAPSRPNRPAGMGLDQYSSVPTPVVAPVPAAVSRNSQPVHARKISYPTPIVSPLIQQTQESDLPYWSLINRDSRYPNVLPPPQTQTDDDDEAYGGFAGVGAGNAAGIGSRGAVTGGGMVYPAVALGPARSASVKKEAIRRASIRRNSAQQSQSQTLPRLSVQQQTGLQSPPPSSSTTSSIGQNRTSLQSQSRSPPPPPPRQSRLRTPPGGPRSKASMNPPMTSPPTVALPVTPPQESRDKPDVPTTPTTPNLSAFPTPPRTISSGTFISATASGSRTPESDSPRSRTSNKPPPISTNLNLVITNGNPSLDTIEASPNPDSDLMSPPLASSRVMSPIQQGSSNADRMDSIRRREMLQNVRNGSGSKGFPQTPITPSLSQEGVHSSPLEGHTSWGVPPSLYAPSSLTGHANSIGASANKRHISQASGRRLSEISPADTEWRELQKQLNWAEDGGPAHVLPPQ